MKRQQLKQRAGNFLVAYDGLAMDSFEQPNSNGDPVDWEVLYLDYPPVKKHIAICIVCYEHNFVTFTDIKEEKKRDVKEIERIIRIHLRSIVELERKRGIQRKIK